jgi:hypothetical protein
MKDCAHCDHNIANDADACPHCGGKVGHPAKTLFYWVLCFAGLIAFFIGC